MRTGHNKRGMPPTTAPGAVPRRELLCGAVASGAVLVAACGSDDGPAAGQSASCPHGGGAQGGSAPDAGDAGAPPHGALRVVTVLENTAPPTSAVPSANKNPLGLEIENGVCWCVERDGEVVLVDVGCSDMFLRNAARLNVDIGAVKAVVISHIHLDHTDGLIAFFQKNDHAKVYMHADAKVFDYWYHHGPLWVHNGMNPAILGYEDRIEFLPTSADPVEVATGMYVYTRIPRADIDAGAFQEPQNLHLCKVPWEKSVAPHPDEQDVSDDDLNHEIGFLVKRDDGIVVVTPCSHTGIVNVLEGALAVFPGAHIEAAIGGFHFVDPMTLSGPEYTKMIEDEAYVRSVAQALVKMDLGRVYTDHCTGLEAYGILVDEYAKLEALDRIAYCTTGDIYTFG